MKQIDNDYVTDRQRQWFYRLAVLRGLAKIAVAPQLLAHLAAAYGDNWRSNPGVLDYAAGVGDPAATREPTIVDFHEWLATELQAVAKEIGK